MKTLNFENLVSYIKNKTIIEPFFIISKIYLISKIRNKSDNGDDILKSVYPYIFENDDFNYDDNFILKYIDFFSFENEDDFLGNLYESTLNKKQKKDYGKFYTRENNVIDYMLDLANYNNDIILEPSCGSGLFLTSMIERLKKNNKYSDKEKLDIIFNNFYAIDIDEFACKLTEINVLIKTIDLIKKVVKNCNSLKLNKLNIVCQNFIDYKELNKNNLIIGNPPYITYYGKRSRNMTEEKRKKFNQFDFVINKKGNNKFNSIMFFIENGIKSLKEHGRLIFIIDITFFETAFIDLRKYILENCLINSITVNLSEFENVASGQVIIELQKENIVYPTEHKCKWIDYKTRKHIFISQDKWYDDKDTYKIKTDLNKIENIINEKIKAFPTLDFYYPKKSLRTCCALTGRTEEFIVEKDKKTNNIIFPYLEGFKGIKNKFGSPKNKLYLEYDYEKQLRISEEFKVELEKIGVKNKKRVTLGDKEMYLSPKIFIRQSANEIIATYTEKPFAANNSIYVLSDKNKDSESKNKLKYVCGILNSDLITFYSKINNIIRGGNGKTPQIKISDLKKIRINIDKKNFNNIVSIVEELLNERNVENNLVQLNKLVYSIYNITKEEVKYIENYLGKYKTNNVSN